MTDRLGTLTSDGEHAVMTFVRRLPYPIERVWAAITDPAQRAAWFGETTIENGTIEMMPSGTPAPPEMKRMTGRILAWEPPRLLEHEWHQGIVEAGVVRYELAPDGGETVLTFTHRGLSMRNAQGFLPGTHAFFDRLEAQLAGEELPRWTERYAEVAPAYPPTAMSDSR
ncbi:SRPBCC family protein [Kibdelosporangium persicum]|uniref:ATPase n=1 Tax=Kibdelosporangium persicum TaxID=2698649 RepID=A0ABX2F8T8_9PSEU|nr:SRPBCC family protein [Kibdelosporangium persicum]NRN67761.1 ATPase [Kibdelosporangium persicum]